METGVARTKMSREELMHRAETVIRRARGETQLLMDSGYIRDFPSKPFSPFLISHLESYEVRRGTTGQDFVIRLEQGEVVHEVLERFAEDKGVRAAALIVVGAADKDSKLGRP